MNYSSIYDSLIQRARSRQLEAGIFIEKHHVIPKCIGGSDASENIVNLTPEEHYVAHQLLMKLHPGVRELAFAAHLMTTHHSGKRNTNKSYGWIKKKLYGNPEGYSLPEETRIKMSKSRKGKKHSEETKRKISEANKGKKRSDDVRKAMSDRQMGVKKGPNKTPRSEEHSRKIAEALKGRKLPDEVKIKLSESRKGIPVSEEAKLKISKANRGRVFSEEHRAKISAARKGVKASEEAKQKMRDAHAKRNALKNVVFI